MSNQIDGVSAILTHLSALEPLLRNPGISEIEVNSPSCVYYEENGIKIKSDITIPEDQLRAGIKRVAREVGEEVINEGDYISPVLNCRWPGGWRLSAVFPPHSVNGITMTLRIFNVSSLTLDNLTGKGMLWPREADRLQEAVINRKNILISGQTGSGKTTLMNVLLNSIPDWERIVTIENPAELRSKRVDPRYSNAVRWEARADFNQQKLLENALRFNPDRILLGEFRGEEALTLLMLMNTGHAGTLSTCHANSAGDTLSRFQLCVQMAPQAPPEATVRQMIAQNVDVVVHLKKLEDGRRVVSEILTEIST